MPTIVKQQATIYKPVELNAPHSGTILRKTNLATSVDTIRDKIGSAHFRFLFHDPVCKNLLASLSLKCVSWLCHKTALTSLKCHDTFAANVKSMMLCEDTLTIRERKVLFIRARLLTGDTRIRRPTLALWSPFYEYQAGDEERRAEERASGGTRRKVQRVPTRGSSLNANTKRRWLEDSRVSPSRVTSSLTMKRHVSTTTEPTTIN